MNEGRKDDTGKTPLALLPYWLLEGVGQVLDYGQHKYDPWNWRKGMSWSRCFSAALRHCFKWWWGEDRDPESGLPHLWHAACCLAFLIQYEQEAIGTDDRPHSMVLPRISPKRDV